MNASSICCFCCHLKTLAPQIQRGFPVDIVRNTNLLTCLLVGKELGSEAAVVSGDQEADHRELSQVNPRPSQASCAWKQRR